jgi:hypothetical protein
MSIGFAVATKVNGVVITSSHSHIPTPYSAACIAAVQLFNAKAYFVQQYLANISSSCFTFSH